MEITIYINLYILCFAAGMAVSIVGYKLYPIICKMIILKKHKKHNSKYEGDFKEYECDFKEKTPL